jgi:hypothetical protein
MPNTRVTAVWSGASGLPGYSRFRFAGALDATAATAAIGRVRTFFEAIKTLIPNGINVSYSEAAQIFSDDGTLDSEVGMTPPAATSGSGTGTYAAPSGAVVNWLTSTVWNGHKVRGRTYLVPLASGAFQSDGTMAVAASSSISAAAAALVAGAPSLIIWSDASPPGGAGPFLTAQTPVTGASVPDRAAVLRSRRD